MNKRIGNIPMNYFINEMKWRYKVDEIEAKKIVDYALDNNCDFNKAYKIINKT